MATKENAKRLEEAVQKAYEALQAACKVADEIGEGFGWHPAYGMGGYYYPARMTKQQAIEILETGRYEVMSPSQKEKVREALRDEYDEGLEPGWHSSSSNC